MLPTTDPRVRALHDALQKKRLSNDKIVASMASGATWPKCFRDHQLAKQAVSSRLEKQAGRGPGDCTLFEGFIRHDVDVTHE